MFKEIGNKIDLVQLEEGILKFWKENKIFKKFNFIIYLKIKL